MGEQEFDAQAYWLNRHQKRAGNIKAVGDLRLSPDDNRAWYNADQQRLAFCLGRLAAGLRGRAVLDAGCGFGSFARPVMASGFDYVGIDLSPDAIATARADVPEATFHIGSLETFELQATFDVIVTRTVLIHVVRHDRWRDALRRLQRHLAPHGVMLLGHEIGEHGETAAHVQRRTVPEYLAALNAGAAGWQADELAANWWAFRRRSRARRLADLVLRHPGKPRS